MGEHKDINKGSKIIPVKFDKERRPKTFLEEMLEQFTPERKALTSNQRAKRKSRLAMQKESRKRNRK